MTEDEHLEQILAEETSYAEWKEGQTPAEEQREMDYWARQPHTVTFEVTIGRDGAEVSCGSNSGSWMVDQTEGEHCLCFSIQSSHAQSRGEEPPIHVDSLYGAIGVAVQKMLEAQQEGDGI